MSEAFAQKYTSEKMVKKNIYLNNKLDELNLKKFRGIYPDALSAKNARKLGESGIIKVGETIEPGESYAAFLSKADLTSEEKILKQMNKGLAMPYSKRTEEWDDDHPGKVVYVKKVGKNIDIHIKVITGLMVGDKLSGLHGNKAIVSTIVPNDEMPHTKAGERMDMIFSPVTVPGRMNIGQMAEAAMGKLVAKTDGVPRKIENFTDTDMLNKIKKELVKNNIPVDEILLDGKTGKPFETPTF